ncbi:MAG: hypothetical protein HeimC3_36620 [Candidatus Heimdallarchaeota archaeon LC_3]|nr:MAG: hypothetical protein HeimC3_36620 [Candidatus Heimdallarchaeota archaeon LC_3]
MKIPVQKSHYGFKQQNSYEHPDLYEESVITLDSPLASIIASDTHIITILLLGNRNSGKSTFIHSFTNKTDKNFFELLSEIPIINSTFINTRFIEDGLPYIDEPPFIDTDIGRGTILLNREDFEFLLSEYNVTHPNFTNKTRYVLIHFIEIGGDHLDRLINNNEDSKDIKEILSQTKAILKTTKQLMYFINFNELFLNNFNKLNFEEFKKITSRIQYLIQNFQLIEEITFVLSRYDEKTASRMRLNQIHDQLKEIIENSKNKFDNKSIKDLIYDYLSFLKIKKFKNTEIDLILGEHLSPDQSLNVRGIMQTLMNIFKKEMILSEKLSKSHVIYYLLKYYNLNKAKFSEDAFWITPKNFETYIANLEFKEIPESIILQDFLSIKPSLLKNGLIVSKTNNFGSNFDIIIETVNSLKMNKKFNLLNNKSELDGTDEIRFPQNDNIFRIFYQFIDNDVPVDFWFKDDKIVISESVIENEKSILFELEEEILEETINYLNKGNNYIPLITKIEDFYMGHKILKKKEGFLEKRLKNSLQMKEKDFYEQFNIIFEESKINNQKDCIIIPIVLTL